MHGVASPTEEDTYCVDPGTGKSSLSLSIDRECDLDVHILRLTGMDDNSMYELFAELPAHCVILLGDIDAATCTYSRSWKGSNK
jgi:hypothetical protein